MRKAVLSIAFLFCAAFCLVAQDYSAPDSVQQYEEYFEVLPPAKVSGRSKKKIKRYGREWREQYRLIYNFNRVYPYALVGRELMAQVDSTIEAGGLKRSERDRYIKNVEKELFRLFEADIRKTTISQGFLLTRLIDRECGMTVYDIIYNYEGGFSAGFWNLVGKLFSQDIKSHYDPEGADKKTEELIKIWEEGEFEWNNFYYSVFGEDPPQTIIKTRRLSTEALNQ